MDPPCRFFKARLEETGRNKYIITDMLIKDVTNYLRIKIKNKISSHNQKKAKVRQSSIKDLVKTVTKIPADKNSINSHYQKNAKIKQSSIDDLV